MKKSLILAGMLVVGYANAQEGNVGINTEEPKATLEVQPSKTNLTGTTNEGIVAPKLSKGRIANIAEANLVEGTLVYATDATYTGNNAKVAKITEKGYYFYNGTEWVKTSAGTEDTSIYTNNGTLSSDRTVTMNGKNLTFEGRRPIIVAKEGNIGFNIVPNSVLTIKGDGGASDDIVAHSYSNSLAHHAFALNVSRYRGTEDAKEIVQAGDYLGALNFRAYNGTSVVGGVAIEAKVSEVEGTGVKTNLILFPTKNVGIGTNDPTEKLEVNGKVKATSLRGTGDRVVYADENGVLKVGDANTGATTLTGEIDLACNDANRGKMNFVKDVTIGSGKGDAFAVCLKGTDGKFYWRYLYGASGMTNSTENFGTGLQ